MIKKISQYLDSHPLISILAIIALIILIIYVRNYRCVDSEHMDGTLTASTTSTTPQPIVASSAKDSTGGQSDCVKNNDATFNAMFVGTTKLLNFKCSIKGKNYYLASVPVATCTNDASSDGTDCMGSKMILIECDDADIQIANYIKTVKLNSEICNQTNRIKCIGNLPPNSSEELISRCSKVDPSCNPMRQYTTDFKVTEVQQTDPDKITRRHYNIFGVSQPLLNDSSVPSMLNGHLYSDQGVNYLCGDMNSSKDQSPVQITIIEKDIQNRGGIIGGLNAPITIKLRMNASQLLSAVETITDPVTKKVTKKRNVVHTIDQKTGKKKTKPAYIGICDGAIECVMGQKKYPRVCLYDDVLDQNVLEFEPILVSNNGGAL
jgi:hypothetical protein